jgi:hypothetical protein
MGAEPGAPFAPPGLKGVMTKRRKGRVIHSDLIGLSIETIRKRARDTSLPPAERLRYRQMEKALGLRKRASGRDRSKR